MKDLALYLILRYRRKFVRNGPIVQTTIFHRRKTATTLALLHNVLIYTETQYTSLRKIFSFAPNLFQAFRRVRRARILLHIYCVRVKL